MLTLFSIAGEGSKGYDMYWQQTYILFVDLLVLQVTNQPVKAWKDPLLNLFLKQLLKLTTVSSGAV